MTKCYVHNRKVHISLRNLQLLCVFLLQRCSCWQRSKLHDHDEELSCQPLVGIRTFWSACCISISVFHTSTLVSNCSHHPQSCTLLGLYQPRPLGNCEVTKLGNYPQTDGSQSMPWWPAHLYDWTWAPVLSLYQRQKSLETSLSIDEESSGLLLSSQPLSISFGFVMFSSLLWFYRIQPHVRRIACISY